MQRRERDLRGAGQEQSFRLERVDVRAVGGEEARPVHRLLADEDGRDHRREVCLDEVLERELVESHRDASGIADDVAEPRAGDARGALHVEAPDLRVLARLAELRRLADAAQLLGVILGIAVGRGVVGRVGDEPECRVALRLGGRELLLGLLERCLDGAEGIELLCRRLALELRLAAELVDLRNQRAPALVGAEQRVEVSSRALARECGAHALGVGSGRLEVDHGESVRALRALDELTPSSTSLHLGIRADRWRRWLRFDGRPYPNVRHLRSPRQAERLYEDRRDVLWLQQRLGSVGSRLVC